MTQLETYLDNFDYFTGKSKLDRQKLKFHQDYNRAKAVYHDDLILYPEIGQKSMKDYEQKKKWVKLNEQDLKDKNFQEAKREQLMELFYRIYDDTSRLATQKIEFEKKMCTLVEERKELLQ